MLLRFILLSFLFSSLAMAEQRDTIRIATYLEPPMIDFVDGKYVGENIDVIRLLIKALNKTPKFLKCPFARCLAMMKYGQADIIVAIRKTTKREKYIGYLERPFEVQHFPLRFYLLKNNKMEINRAEDLNNISIGVLRGVTYYDEFDDNNDLKKISVTNLSQLIKMLLSNRIDTFIEREESIIPLVDNEVYQQKIKLAQYQYDKSVSSYIGISKKSPLHKDIDIISKKLAHLLDSGAIDSIINQ